MKKRSMLLMLALSVALVSSPVSATGNHEKDSSHKDTRNITVKQENHVNISNRNYQKAQSGDATVKHNTSGGSAVTGNATNSNKTANKVNLKTAANSQAEDCLCKDRSDSNGTTNKDEGTIKPGECKEEENAKPTDVKKDTGKTVVNTGSVSSKVQTTVSMSSDKKVALTPPVARKVAEPVAPKVPASLLPKKSVVAAAGAPLLARSAFPSAVAPAVVHTPVAASVAQVPQLAATVAGNSLPRTGGNSLDWFVPIAAILSLAGAYCASRKKSARE